MQEKFKLFYSLISKINKNIRRIKTEIMLEHDIKCPHVSTLYYLYAEGEMTLKQLCDVCKEDKSAISRSIASLEKNGLVNSQEEGKYKNKLSLTQKGLEIGKEISAKIDTAIEFAVQGLGVEDRDIIYAGLGVIANNLGKFKISKEKRGNK